jgi:hypothetical protein
VISDATLARPGLDPGRGSFAVALHAARNQLVRAAGVIAVIANDASVLLTAPFSIT